MTNYSKAHICQCLTRLSTCRRDAVVTITGNRRKTGQEFVGGVLSLANRLFELGFGNGDVVAICAFNSDWYLEWLLAVTFVGGIVAPLNYRWSFEEAKSAMLMTKPVMLVTDESCSFWYSRLQSSAVTSLRWHFFIGSSSSGFMKTSNVSAVERLLKCTVRSISFDYFWAPEDAAIICFTSGTTGKPKGVIISHSALIVQSREKVAILRYSKDDVHLHTLPLGHIGGLSSALAMLMVGACHVLIPKFEAAAAVDAIEKQCVTSLITIPAIVADLVSLSRLNGKWEEKQLVKKILNGGGSLSDELIKSAVKLFPRAKIFSAYGMTETCSSLTFMTLHDPVLETSSDTLHIGETKSSCVSQPLGVCVGKPPPHVELKISPEGRGRILTRGPHIMLRYWDQRPTNALDHTSDVWLDTGDIGSIDDSGNLWLLGRANGRIKSGGENVHPEEVEGILVQHPGVIAAVIVGVPNLRLTEMVVACIKLREGWKWSDNSCKTLDENQPLLCSDILQNYCKAKYLTGFKVPKVFILWGKPFPLTIAGKIRRDQLRKEAISHLQSSPSNL